MREVRAERQLSQGDIDQTTGFLRRYVSRVENGFTAATAESLEKFAGALEIAVYWFFTAAEQLKMLKLPPANAESAGEVNGEHRREIRLFGKPFSRMDDCKQKLVLRLARKKWHVTARKSSGPKARLS